MVAPLDPLKITLNDLIRSSQGETVVQILTDLNGFWSYENREVLVKGRQAGAGVMTRGRGPGDLIV